eukprot:tig00020572_g11568.t1
MALPTAGQKFTLQEDWSKKCLFFDQTQQDMYGDWALRAEPCDPKSATLDPKFVWAYSPLPDANLEAQGYRGLVNQGRIPDMPGGWTGNVWQWNQGQLLRGYHTQTNDPDQRVLFENAAAMGDGGVRVNFGSAPVWGQSGYWAFDGADSSIKVFPWTPGAVQTFVVTVYPPPPPPTTTTTTTAPTSEFGGYGGVTNVGARGGSSGGVRALQVEAEGQQAAEEAGAGLRDGLFGEAGRPPSSSRPTPTSSSRPRSARARTPLPPLPPALFSYNDSEL